jgi:uncharacterized membrane protein YozB (DUF420 family)
VKLDIFDTEELLFLVNSGSCISLAKTEKLNKPQKFDQEHKIKVKIIERYVIETLRTVESVICERSLMIPCEFHLINQQVDIPAGRILGRYFLERTGTHICFQTGASMIGMGDMKMHMLMLAVDMAFISICVFFLGYDQQWTIPGRTALYYYAHLPQFFYLCSRILALGFR